MEHIKSVAFSGYYLRGSSSGETVFGRNVAAKELLANFFKYTTAEELCFCYVNDFYQYHMVNRFYRILKQNYKINAKLTVLNRIDILQKHTKIESDIICDCVENFQQAVFLREKYSAKYPPISITIHCASEINAINHSLIPALLIGMKPYDTFFCGSVAVKRVLKKQFEHICDCFKNLYGLTIKPMFRLDVVPLGIDDDEFKPVKKEQAREALDIPQNEFVILYLGRVSAFFKGDLLPLIRVVKNLCDKNPDKNIRLIIAGADYIGFSEYKQIKRYISALNMEKNITIYESFDYDKRNILYSASDVFTSPADSIQETFGLTPLEAMACGVPQVVADWDGYKETVSHGETGYRVPTYWSRCDEDISAYPDALTEEFSLDRFYSHFLLGQSVAIDLNYFEYYLQKLLDNPVLQKNMSAKSIEVFKKNYTLKQTVRSYEAVWDELIRIKSNTKCESTFNLDLFNNRFFDMFSHYPTYNLDNSAEFQITELGRQVMFDRSIVPWHYQQEKSFNEVVLALKILDDFKTKECFTINDAIILNKQSYNMSVIKRSVMWLFKHGFIEHTG